MVGKSRMPEAEASGFIPTLNKTGYMTATLDNFSSAFVEYSSLIDGAVLEIGAAYGIATLKAIEKGAKVIANDLDIRHLEILYQKCPLEKRKYLTLLPGSFPDNLTLPSEFISGVLISRVLHFFDGEMIKRSLKKIFDWMKIKSKVFIVAETPYLKNWINFIPEYERRIGKGEKWPGLIKNASDFTNLRLEQLPKMVHWLDEKVLTRELEEAGFFIEKIEYINRLDFPEDVKLDGRESIGVIAVKL